MTRTTLFLPILAAAVAGCLPVTPGDMHNGGFTYFCASDNDLACQYDLYGASDLPPAVAVGAHFDLQFTPELFSSADQPTVTNLVSVAPSILSGDASGSPDSTGFRFIAPGIAAVLARGDGRVVDFVHVTGARLDHVDIIDSLGDTASTLQLWSYGETLKALPRDHAKGTLAGALKYTWTSSDESIVSLSPGYLPNEVDLTPGEPGEATVTVTAQDAQAQIAVTVGGDP